MLVAERDHDGAGQRGEIDHEFRLEAIAGIPQHIGEDEPAFGIGIDDLDGLSGHRGDDVAGALGIAVGHVLDEPDHPHGVDLRLAPGEGVHQADDAGGSRHVALHVLHPGGRLDRYAPGIEADALADEGDRRRAALAPVPAHHRDPALPGGSLVDAEQGGHAEFPHGLLVEHLDGDAELLELGRPTSEFDGKQHVGRLVDQIAGQGHAVGNRLPAAPGLAGAGHVADAKRHPRPRRLVFAFLALRLVAIERIGPQPHPQGDIRCLLGLQRAGRQLEQHRRLDGRARNPAHDGAAELHEVGFFGGLAGPHHGEPRRLQAGRNHDLEGRAGLSGEPVGARRAGEKIPGRLENGPRRGSEPQFVIGKNNQDAPARCREGGESELHGFGHGGEVPRDEVKGAVMAAIGGKSLWFHYSIVRRLARSLPWCCHLSGLESHPGRTGGRVRGAARRRVRGSGKGPTRCVAHSTRHGSDRLPNQYLGLTPRRFPGTLPTGCVGPPSPGRPLRGWAGKRDIPAGYGNDFRR